jgi:hypothetical protein
MVERDDRQARRAGVSWRAWRRAGRPPCARVLFTFPSRGRRPPPPAARPPRHSQTPRYPGLCPEEALAAYEEEGLDAPGAVLALPESFDAGSSSDDEDDAPDDGGSNRGGAAAAARAAPPGARHGRKGVGRCAARGGGGAAAAGDEGEGYEGGAEDEEEEDEEEVLGEEEEAEEEEEEGDDLTEGGGAGRSAAGSANSGGGGAGGSGGGGGAGSAKLDPGTRLRRSGYWWRFEFDDTALRWVVPAPDGGYKRVHPVCKGAEAGPERSRREEGGRWGL